MTLSFMIKPFIEFQNLWLRLHRNPSKKTFVFGSTTVCVTWDDVRLSQLKNRYLFSCRNCLYIFSVWCHYVGFSSSNRLSYIKQSNLIRFCFFVHYYLRSLIRILITLLPARKTLTKTGEIKKLLRNFWIVALTQESMWKQRWIWFVPQVFSIIEPCSFPSEFSIKSLECNVDRLSNLFLLISLSLSLSLIDK